MKATATIEERTNDGGGDNAAAAIAFAASANRSDVTAAAADNAVGRHVDDDEAEVEMDAPMEAQHEEEQEEDGAAADQDDEEDDDGQTPLHALVENGSCTASQLHALLSSSPSSWLLQKTASGGYTPLHLACRAVASDEVVLTLARAGGPASVAATDEEGDTALHTALRYGASENVVRGLIQVCLQSAPPPVPYALHHGAPPPAAAPISALYAPDSSDGDLPLHSSLRHSPSPETVKALLDAAPGTVAALNRDGQTPLSVACDESGDRGVGLEVLEVLFGGAARLFGLRPVPNAAPLVHQAHAQAARVHAEGAMRGWCTYPDASGRTPVFVLWEKYVNATFGPDDTECREEIEDDDDVSVASADVAEHQDEEDDDSEHEAAAATTAASLDPADSTPHELWDSLVLLLTAAHTGRVLSVADRNRPFDLVDAALGLALRGHCPPDLLELIARYHPDELRNPDARGRLVLHRALEEAAGVTEAGMGGAATAASARRQRRSWSRAAAMAGPHAGQQPSRSPPSPTTVMDAPNGGSEVDDDAKEVNSAATIDAAAVDAKPSPPPALSPAGAAVRIILAAHPSAASHADDDGRLPLHIAAGASATSTASASMPFQPRPRLQPGPLAWAEDGVEEVFLACPSAGCRADVRTGLAPFMLAAASSASALSKASTVVVPASVPAAASASMQVSSARGTSAFAPPAVAGTGHQVQAVAVEDDDDVAAVEAAFELLLRSPWLVKGGIPADGKGKANTKTKTEKANTEMSGTKRSLLRRLTTASSSPEKKRRVAA